MRTATPGEQALREAARKREAYAGLVERIHDVIAWATPAGAAVVFASKGTSELVAVPGRRGSHLLLAPDGSPAAYHPAATAEIVDRLSRLARAESGGFFVVPSHYLWWLDHYDGLSDYLDEHCTLVVDAADTCRLYRVGADRPAERAAVTAISNPLTDRAMSLVRALLPPSAAVVVWTDGRLERVTVPAGGEIRYVVVPAPRDSPAPPHPTPPEGLEGARLVTHQRWVCTIFEVPPAADR